MEINDIKRLFKRIFSPPEMVMKESSRVVKAQKTLEKIKEYLQYYMGQSTYESKQVSKDIDDLEELLANLSVDQKKLFARALGKVRKEERKK